MDSYHYYGMDDLYLGDHLVKLVRPEGQIGIVVPGLVRELPAADPPEHLQPNWASGESSFHSPDWWRRHWELSGLVSIELADMVPDGWKHWATSDEISAEWKGERSEEAEYVRLDAGRNLGFTRVVARRRRDPRWR